MNSPTQKTIDNLSSLWHATMGASSDPRVLMDNPHYRAIVAYGRPAIPFILAALRRENSLLVWSLPDITGENPVREDSAGNIRKMNEDWQRWWREQNNPPPRGNAIIHKIFATAFSAAAVICFALLGLGAIASGLGFLLLSAFFSLIATVTNPN